MEKPSTLLGIVKLYLKENGYDGLCTDDCGCDGSLPCCGLALENEVSSCAPAYRQECFYCKDTCGDHDPIRDGAGCYGPHKQAT